MSRRSLEQAHTYREVHSALQHSPTLVGMRNGGRHVVYTGPNGCVPVATHVGDIPRPTLRSIAKMAALAGLAVLMMAFVIGVVA